MTTPASRPAPHPTRRPVVAVDVDGVLNPIDPSRAATYGYQPHRYTGPAPDGHHVDGTVWLHPCHGPWLRELAATGAEMVWCTSWRHLAATWLAERLALPTGWHVIDIAGSGVRWGHQIKLFDLYAHAGDRPVAVLDDTFGGKDPSLARQRTRAGKPTLLRPVNPVHGMRRPDVDAVLHWLRRL